MPCSDSAYRSDDIAVAARVEIDRLTRLLCESMTAGEFTAEAKRWFQLHRRADQTRLEREKQMRLRQRESLQADIDRITRELLEADEKET